MQKEFFSLSVFLIKLYAILEGKCMIGHLFQLFENKLSNRLNFKQSLSIEQIAGSVNFKKI
jgi:hypothetical protein